MPPLTFLGPVNTGDTYEAKDGFKKTGFSDTSFLLAGGGTSLVANFATYTNIAAAYYTKLQLQTSGQAQVHWGNLTDIPSTFPATAHNHDDRYYLKSESVPYTGADKTVDLNTQQLTLNGIFEKKSNVFELSHLGNESVSSYHFKRLTDVASLSLSSSSIIGDIIITIPIRTSTRWVMEVDIFNPVYLTEKLIISAYSITNALPQVSCLTDTEIISEVKFCRDANNNTVLILKRATGTSSFTYGKVNINDFYHGVSYNTDLAVKSNYKVEFIDESTLTGITVNSIVKVDKVNFGTKNIDFTSGAISKTQNGIRHFRDVYHLYTGASNYTGIISMSFPTQTTSATMFRVEFEFGTYTANTYTGKLLLTFYKQNSATINGGSFNALWMGKTDLPISDIKIGFTATGNIAINFGNASTVWNAYTEIRVSSLSSRLNGWSQDYSKGWTHEFITDETGYTGLVTVPLTISANQDWVNTQITNAGHSHSNKANLDTINQDLGTTHSPLFAGLDIRGSSNEQQLKIRTLDNLNKKHIGLYTATGALQAEIYSKSSGGAGLTIDVGDASSAPLPNAMFISRVNQYVGINNLNPLERLHVGGNVLATGYKVVGSTGFLKANGSVDNNGYFPYITSNGVSFDANTLNENGVRGNNIWTNTPGGFTSIGVLDSKVYNNGWVAQSFVKLNNPPNNKTNLYIRHKYGGTAWSNWEEVYHTGNFNPANYATSTHTHSWSDITSGIPDTLSGYGITDAYTKTEVDAKVASTFKPKGSVANFAALPTTGQQEGDVWNLLDTGKNVVWVLNLNNTGNPGWDDLSGTVDLSGYALQSWVTSNFASATHTHSWTQITGKPDFHAVATSGNYSDLNGLPTIPTQYTDEMAQDAVGAMASTEFTYNDATNSFGINTINASKITQSANYRFVTDTEKTAWNAKQAALSGTGFVKISGSTISYDNNTYSLSTHNHTLDSLSNVTISLNTAGEILKWDGSKWVNNTLTEAGIQPAGNYASATHSHAISDVSGLQSALDGKVDDSQVLTNVPLGAVFTDTVYTHPTTPGNKHIPAGGAANQILRWSALGTAVWSDENNTTYSVFAGTATPGLVPGRVGATVTKYLREDGTWTVPPNDNTTYSVFTTGVAGLVPARVGSTAVKFLREDGTWVTPTNTTYSAYSGTTTGLVPARDAGATTTKYLNETGSWSIPTDTTYSAGTYANIDNSDNKNKVWSGEILKEYFDNYIETSHAANSVTSTLINNWNAAFGWGSHTGLYLPLSGGQLTGELSIRHNPGLFQPTHEFKTNQAGGRNDFYIRADNGANTLRFTSANTYYLFDIGGGMSASNQTGFDFIQIPASNSQFRVGYYATQFPGYMSAVSGHSWTGGNMDTGGSVTVGTDVYVPNGDVTVGNEVSANHIYSGTNIHAEDGFVHNQYDNPDILLTSNGGAIHKKDLILTKVVQTTQNFEYVDLASNPELREYQVIVWHDAATINIPAASPDIMGMKIVIKLEENTTIYYSYPILEVNGNQWGTIFNDHKVGVELVCTGNSWIRTLIGGTMELVF